MGVMNAFFLKDKDTHSQKLRMLIYKQDYESYTFKVMNL